MTQIWYWKVVLNCSFSNSTTSCYNKWRCLRNYVKLGLINWTIRLKILTSKMFSILWPQYLNFFAFIFIMNGLSPFPVQLIDPDGATFTQCKKKTEAKLTTCYTIRNKQFRRIYTNINSCNPINKRYPEISIG